jgi:hypothetical protein
LAKSNVSKVNRVYTCTYSNRLMTTIDTRERLKAFNEYASARYQELYKSYEQHTTLLHQLRKDLDSIFKRIR